MTISTVHCHVLPGTVTRVADLEGQTTRIICPEFDEATGQCRLRQRELEGGPLGRLLVRTAQEDLDTSSARCALL